MKKRELIKLSVLENCDYTTRDIAEELAEAALADKKRSAVSATSKITSLADISIYTDDEEVKLQQVFLNMKEVLGDNDAPSAKSSADELKALFEKALPDYDRDRFYVSHMKKVVEWYNALKNYASLDFVNPEEAEEEAAE